MDTSEERLLHAAVQEHIFKDMYLHETGVQFFGRLRSWTSAVICLMSVPHYGAQYAGRVTQ